MSPFDRKRALVKVRLWPKADIRVRVDLGLPYSAL